MRGVSKHSNSTPLWEPEVKGVSRILSVAIESCFIAMGQVSEVFAQPWSEEIETFKSKFSALAKNLVDFSFGHIRS